MKLPPDKRISLADRRQFIKDVSVSAAAILAGHTLLTQIGCSTGTGNYNSQRISMPTRTQMKNALKDRISTDDPGNFSNNLNNWDQVRLGIYYDEDKELVDIAIYETTSQAVGQSRYLPGPIWRNLIASIGPVNTPEQAVDPMMDAALRSEPRQPNDEGPINDRPPRKPTLRSARKPANG